MTKAELIALHGRLKRPPVQPAPPVDGTPGVAWMTTRLHVTMNRLYQRHHDCYPARVPRRLD